jgi:hypothetical protein
MEEISEQYMKSIMGQQVPLEVSGSKSVFLELLRVDSLWNLGRGDDARALLSKLDIPQQYMFFGRGLQALLDEKLQDAYHNFVQASSHSQGLDTVFYGERAVNVSNQNFATRMQRSYSVCILPDCILDGVLRKNVASCQ